MENANYWKRYHRQALSRRGMLGGATAAGAGLAGLALAGCGDDDDKTPAKTATQPAGPAGPNATASASATAPTRVDFTKITNEADFFKALPEMPPKDYADADIKAGGTLTRLYNREPPLDFVNSGLTGPISEAINGVYSRLIRLSNSADIKNPYDPFLEPDLATKWERPDAQSIILTLADNIKFQNVAPLNGRALKIDDIKYTFERGKTYAKSLYKSPFSLIQSVEDVGGGKVKFTLAGPHPAIEQQFSAFYMNIIPPEIGDKPEVAASTAVGTGPMIMKYNQGVSYEYRKNPDYFKKDAQGRQKPYIDGYKLVIVNDLATRLAQLEKGDVDFIYNAANPITLDNAFDFFKRNPNWVVEFRVSTKPSYAFVGRHDRAPWNDVRVRQALSLSIDRKTVLQQLYKGFAVAQPFFPWNLAVDKAPTLESLGQYYQLDPKKAKDLLTAAGLANGVDLDVHWYDVPSLEDTLIIFKQSAAQAGIRLNLVKAPDAAAHSAKQVSDSWNGLLLQGRSLDFIDPMASMAYFRPGGLNPGKVDDPKLNELYEKQRTTVDPTARKAVFKQIWDYMNEATLEVTIPAANRMSYWRPWVKGWRDTSWDADTGFGTGQMDSIWVGPKT